MTCNFKPYGNENPRIGQYNCAEGTRVNIPM